MLLAEDGGDHQDSPDHRDQPDEQKRLGCQRVLAKRDLHRVQQLDEQQHQEDLIEQPADAGGDRPGERGLAEADEARHQKEDDDAGEQEPEPDVHDVLEVSVPARDPRAWFPPRRHITGRLLLASSAGYFFITLSTAELSLSRFGLSGWSTTALAVPRHMHLARLRIDEIDEQRSLRVLVDADRPCAPVVAAIAPIVDVGLLLQLGVIRDEQIGILLGRHEPFDVRSLVMRSRTTWPAGERSNASWLGWASAGWKNANVRYWPRLAFGLLVADTVVQPPRRHTTAATTVVRIVCMVDSCLGEQVPFPPPVARATAEP